MCLNISINCPLDYIARVIVELLTSLGVNMSEHTQAVGTHNGPASTISAESTSHGTSHDLVQPPKQRAVTRLQQAEGPSARFGWHSKPHSITPQILGWLSVVGLLLFLIGNHQGHIEDFYVILFAVGLSILLIRDLYLRKKDHLPKY